MLGLKLNHVSKRGHWGRMAVHIRGMDNPPNTTSQLRVAVQQAWVTPRPDRLRTLVWSMPLQWRHNDHDGVSNHQPHGSLLNLLFRRRSKKTSKLRVTGLCAGTGEFPAQRASNADFFPFDYVIMPRRVRAVLAAYSDHTDYQPTLYVAIDPFYRCMKSINVFNVTFLYGHYSLIQVTVEPPDATAHCLHLPGNYSYWRIGVERHSSHPHPWPHGGICVSASYDDRWCNLKIIISLQRKNVPMNWPTVYIK